MDYKKLGKGAGRYFLRNLTPIPTLKRQAGEIAGSVRRIGEAFAAVKNAGNRPQPMPPQDGGEVKLATPEERFEKAYEEGGWTEMRLLIQAGKIRIAKWIYFAAGLLLPFFAAHQMAFGNIFQAGFIAPLLMLGAVVLLAQALKHAWLWYQIFSRSFVPMREFMDHPQFWHFVFR